jgi:hypothetical protein
LATLIRPYEDRDERSWLICRLLAFFDTAFFDSVERSKERYERPSIELVAERDGEIVGLLDLECESDGLADRPDLRAFDDGDLRLVKAFAHYTGDRRDEIRGRYQRVHDDVLYEKRLDT